MDRGVWQAVVHGVVRVGHDLVTKPHHHKPIDTLIGSQCEKDGKDGKKEASGEEIWKVSITVMQ